MLSKKLTTEFQKICKEEFGMDMTPEKAESVGTALLKYTLLLQKLVDGIRPHRLDPEDS